MAAFAAFFGFARLGLARLMMDVVDGEGVLAFSPWRIED